MASITFESFIKEYNIEIPAIQRDYVQGRGFTVEEQDKRDSFVDKLIKHISEEDIEPCHLEFIYGAESEKSESFIPLDGQQRLTTLFLLHWVVWQMSPMDNKPPLEESIAGFRYETRLSSLAFCENIVHKTLIATGEKKLSKLLMEQPWFSVDWVHDPTIASMLSMIDCIEEKLSSFDEEKLSLMLTNLNSDKKFITFDKLVMTEYGLTDSLYIKMNARGKQLTKFENWKSDFIKYLENEFGQEVFEKADPNRKVKSFSYKDYFCHSIEHEWTDLFWVYLKEEYLMLSEKEQKENYPNIDHLFMNLFNSLCKFKYYANGGGKDFEKISGTEQRQIWQNKEFIDFLFESLDSLHRIDHKTFFNELFYICDKELPLNNDERKLRLFRTKDTNLFKLCVVQGIKMELTDQLLFQALLTYCNMHQTTIVDDSLKAYMRTIRNYFESDIQNLRTRTTVQLNLRLSEFAQYKSVIINNASKSDITLPDINKCIIEDCSITNGNIAVFDKSIVEYGYKNVIEALSAFCTSSTIERIRLLIACGFEGTRLGDCIGRKRVFFGNKDKWDVLFISDSKQLSECFALFTKKISEGKDSDTIIKEALDVHFGDFAYYMLKYDSFIKANGAQYHFAINGNINDVDCIALGSYSSNPGTAYHADPLSVSVEKEILNKNDKIQLSLYKQYSGKCPLSIVKDKIHWEPMFSIISRKTGWHIILGQEYLTEKLWLDFNIQKSDNNNLLIPKCNDKDMIAVCSELIIKVYDNISCVEK